MGCWPGHFRVFLCLLVFLFQTSWNRTLGPLCIWTEQLLQMLAWYTKIGILKISYQEFPFHFTFSPEFRNFTLPKYNNFRISRKLPKKFPYHVSVFRTFGRMESALNFYFVARPTWPGRTMTRMVLCWQDLMSQDEIWRHRKWFHMIEFGLGEFSVTR